MRIAHRQVTDSTITNRVRERYHSEIDTLRRTGFQELCFYTESLSPFSLLVLFPILLLMRAHREVIQIQSPLKITASYPLLVHRERATYALVMGMGIKFYTDFIDGTGLITANFPTQDIQDQTGKLYKYGAPQTIELAWQSHQDRIGELGSAGKQLSYQLGFEGYIELSEREDRHRSAIAVSGA